MNLQTPSIIIVDQLAKLGKSMIAVLKTQKLRLIHNVFFLFQFDHLVLLPIHDQDEGAGLYADGGTFMPNALRDT